MSRPGGSAPGAVPSVRGAIARFAIAGLVALAALGVVGGLVLRDLSEREAVDDARRLATPPKKSATPHVTPDRRPRTTASTAVRQPRPCGRLRSSSGPLGTMPVGLIESCVR